MEGFLSGGNVNDIVAAPALVKDVIGGYVLADRGYDSDDFRRALAANNTTPVIPGRKNRQKPVKYDHERYKKRSYIERLFGKIKENRRLTLRYEKSDMNFLAFIQVAFINIYLC